MKKKFLSFLIVIAWATVIFLSCKKEKSCDGCINGNKPPIASAGPDQVIALPSDSISLDGSASTDPDGMIIEWLWTKISGLAFLNISCATTVSTIVENISVGNYQWRFKTFQS